MHLPPNHRTGALLAALALAGPIAGCLGGGSTDPAPPDAGAPSPGAGAAQDEEQGASPEAPSASPPPLVGPPHQRTLFLTPAGGLAEVVPPPASVAMAGGFIGLGTSGTDFLQFRSGALAEPVLVQAQPVVVSLWLEAQAPVLGSGRFDLAGYFGSTRGLPLGGFGAMGGPLMPGAPKLYEVQLPFDSLLPFVVPAGEALELLVLSGAVHEESGILQLLMGGETASSVTLTVSNLTADPLAGIGPLAETRETDTIPAPEFPAGDAAGGEGRTYIDHEVVLGPGTTYVEITVTLTEGHGSTDLDIELFDGERLISGAHTPRSDEALLVVGPSAIGLEGKTLTLRVTAFVGVQSSYEVLVRHD